MALSEIHLLNWFYSFSLNRLSLFCFCNWKKKRGKPDLTHNPIDPFKNDSFWTVTRLTRKPNWPDLTHPFCHVYPWDTRENQLSPSYLDSSHSSHVLGTCFTSRVSFSRDTRENSLLFTLPWVFTLSLSHTTLIRNPT